MEKINGYYYRFKHIKKIEIKLFLDDEKTISKINNLIESNPNIRLCKTINKDSYFNEYQIKILYNQNANINAFIVNLIKLNIKEIKYFKKWRYESILTF